MADSIKSAPNYENTKRGMFRDSLKAFLWGVASVTLIVVGVPLCHIGIGIPLVAAGIYAGYKGYKANIDERAGYAEINSQRTAQLLAQKIKEASVSLPTISPEEQAAYKNWQQQEDLRRAAAAAQQQNAVRGA